MDESSKLLAVYMIGYSILGHFVYRIGHSILSHENTLVAVLIYVLDWLLNLRSHENKCCVYFCTGLVIQYGVMKRHFRE